MRATDRSIWHVLRRRMLLAVVAIAASGALAYVALPAAHQRMEAQTVIVKSVPDEQPDAAEASLRHEIASAAQGVALAEAELQRERAAAQEKAEQRERAIEPQLSALEAELSKAQVAQGEAELRLKSTRDLARSGGVEALPETETTPTLRSLAQNRLRLERQLAKLSAQQRAAPSPRAKALAGEVAALKGEIDAELARVIAGLDGEVKAVAGRVEDIAGRLESLKAQ
jgi:uncharacterized protein involved in exopolysaccharide biosynthesis